MEKTSLLKQYFGHSAFRNGQEALVDGLLSGRDVFGIMPTGGGKSICYQLPALMLPGVTLVVSPLISLMKDQVMALNAVGIPAAFINSSLSLEDAYEVYRNARLGIYKIIYVAPERLEMEGFLGLAQKLDISLIAVDEAHCISQWGQDFRPSYLKIPRFIDALPHRPPVGAFTATATENVREDVIHLLELDNPLCKIMGFDRPNLYFDVKAEKNKPDALRSLLSTRREKSGIVYCATRASVERVCEMLCQDGLPATRYHAGLSDEERHRNQEDFQFDRKTIMVATNAFGMGIDKSNVNYVIHYNMPKSLEAYYQEAGRAGRDGTDADCILLFSNQDVLTAQYLIENGGNEELSDDMRQKVLRSDHKRLNAMVGYCKTACCLRGYILDYFGQEHAPKCDNCGNCGELEWQDITVTAQMILSCIWRIRKQLNHWVGATMVCDVLRGSKQAKLLSLQLDKLSTYGILQKMPQQQVRDYIDALEKQGYLLTDMEHLTLQLTQKANDVLFRGDKVQIKGKPIAKAVAQKPSGNLLEVLRSLRTKLALEQKVPSYMIFSNATLEDMAFRKPTTPEEFLQVNGVGKVKAEKFGKVFLEKINEHLGSN